MEPAEHSFFGRRLQTLSLNCVNEAKKAHFTGEFWFKWRRRVMPGHTLFLAKRFAEFENTDTEEQDLPFWPALPA